MINLITSVNPALYEQYGRQMVAGFETFSADDVRLIVVFEGAMPADADRHGDRCVFVPFVSADHQRFVKYFGHLYEANGLRLTQVETPKGISLTAEKQYLFDAVRFSFKLFAIEIGWSKIPEGSGFAWIDADVRCLKRFSHADLKPFLPGPNDLMSYLGRDKFFSECGFLGFNPGHPRIRDFFARMRTLYLTGEIFSLEQWHDSWLWDVVRREFEQEGTSFRNISGAASGTPHPFINSGLGQFFDHLKGPTRKVLGRSQKEDYILRKDPRA